MLKLPEQIRGALIEQAQKEAPAECCGLLAGVDDRVTEIYPITNLPSDDPRVADLKVPEDRKYRYIMDPKGQLAAFKHMRAHQLTLLAIYHSHPHSPAYPSATDVRLAVYPEVHYIIVSLMKEPEIRIFRIVEEQITEETLCLMSP